MELDKYFSSYEDFEVHRLMLEDKPRTQSYKDAIFNNKDLFKDKVVMDVGCGTGILSIFSAQAGADKVYGVEASKMAQVARKVVEENDLSNKIEILESRVEDLKLEVKVDIIVCEWMGVFLLHEGMLDSLIFARDKFLKEDGLLFPEMAELFVAPCESPKFFNYWDDVYGIKMKSVGVIERSSINKPVIMNIQKEELLGESRSVARLNLNVVSKEEISSISKKIVSSCCRDGLFQGVCLWFRCEFPSFDDMPIILDTHPQSDVTHWKQTVIVFPKELKVEKQEPVAFQLDLKRNYENNRRYDIEFTILDPEEETHETPCSCYRTKCVVIKAFLEQQETNECIEEIECDE